jgi:hypothetical protein
MSVRSEVEYELNRRGIYGHSSTAGETLLTSWKIIMFALFALNITVWSPGMIVLFLCQRTLINKGTLLAIIYMGLIMSFVNAFLAYMYAGNGWIRWDSFQHVFKPDALNWISGVQNWWYQNLYFSILLWSLAIGLTILQLIISYFAPNTKEYGYGLLSLFCLFTRNNPSGYLTSLQDGVLAGFVAHIIVQKQFDLIGKTSIFCLASTIMFWIIFSALSLDESRWETYSVKNTMKLDKEIKNSEREMSKIMKKFE